MERRKKEWDGKAPPHMEDALEELITPGHGREKAPI